MIPKDIIQLYNNVNRVKNSKKITNSKLSSRYKILGKRISFIFMKLYTHSTMSLDSENVDDQFLYHVGLILQHLGLIKINTISNTRYKYDNQGRQILVIGSNHNLYLTLMGKRFIHQKLLNRLVHTSIFPKISIDIFLNLDFLNLYREEGCGNFYLNLMWIIIPPLFIMIISAIFQLSIATQIMLFKMYGYSFIALVLENIKVYTVPNKFQFAYIDLLDFCKRHGKSISYVRKCVKQFYTSDDDVYLL